MGKNCTVQTRPASSGRFRHKKSGAASIRMQPPQNTQSVFFHVLSFYTMGYHLSMADEITSKVDWISELLLYEYTEMVIFYWTLC